MPYERMWSSAQPGCLILLLDQSGSMSDPFSAQQVGSGQRKCDVVCTILNRILKDFIESSSEPQNDGTILVKPRADIAILGYHSGSVVGSALQGSLAGKEFVTLAELQADPLRVEPRITKQLDPAGNLYDDYEYLQIWVEPVAEGGTPMNAAMERASELAAGWAAAHQDHFPPVVVNITDGVWTDRDPTQTSQKLLQVQTNDGTALLFNCHITDKKAAKVEFPERVDQVPNDQYARALFSISSLIPPASRNEYLNTTGMALTADARGYIFNGDAMSVRNMIVLGSVAGAPDPNR